MSKVITGKVRFSYVALLNPRNDLNGNSKYSVTALLPKSDIQTKQAIDAAIAQAIEEGRNGKWNGVVPPVVPTPIHDGDGVKDSGEPYGDECKGCWVFTASTNADPTRPRPEIVGPDLQPIMSATEVYSGMYGRLSVNFAPYFSAGKRGIGCYLNNVQKLEDGTPLGGSKASASEDFGGGQQPTQPQYGQPAQPQYGQPAQPQYGQPAQPQIDPITGQPIIQGGVMGL
nr:MAG TPA: DNA helix destabilizing protein [Caudoviricetes sp.]